MRKKISVKRADETAPESEDELEDEEIEGSEEDTDEEENEDPLADFENKTSEDMVPMSLVQQLIKEEISKALGNNVPLTTQVGEAIKPQTIVVRANDKYDPEEDYKVPHSGIPSSVTGGAPRYDESPVAGGQFEVKEGFGIARKTITLNAKGQQVYPGTGNSRKPAELVDEERDFVPENELDNPV